MAETCDLIIIDMGVGGIEVADQGVGGATCASVRRTHSMLHRMPLLSDTYVLYSERHGPDIRPRRSSAHRRASGLSVLRWAARNPDSSARGTVAELIADLDAEGTERALVIPNYGVPDPAVSFSFNELVLEARRQGRPDQLRAVGLTSTAGCRAQRQSPCARRREGRQGPQDQLPARRARRRRGLPPQLDQIFDTAREHGLVVHVHTSSGGASDIDKVGSLVDRYGDDVKIHLVHLGGGVSAHIKLIGSRLFDWIEAGKQVYTDTSWAVGFAPRWLVQ